MMNDLNTLKETLENIGYQKKKYLQLSDDLRHKRKQQETARVRLDKENRDVEKIMGLSFASFMATLLNNRSEKLEKEELEALEAKQAYDAISYEVEALNEEVKTLEVAIAKEDRIKRDYQIAYDNRKKEISDRDAALWSKINVLDIELTNKITEAKEIKEAEIACSETLQSIYTAVKELDDARSMGAWDMMGGGLLATMAKRDHMDRAQRAINEVNYKLKRLTKELSDINEDRALEIRIDDYLGFADFFFDGFFVDMMVQSKIKESQVKVENLKKEMEALLNRLNGLYSQAEAKKTSLKKDMDQLILNQI